MFPTLHYFNWNFKSHKRRKKMNFHNTFYSKTKWVNNYHKSLVWRSYNNTCQCSVNNRIYKKFTQKTLNSHRLKKFPWTINSLQKSMKMKDCHQSQDSRKMNYKWWLNNYQTHLSANSTQTTYKNTYHTKKQLKDCYSTSMYKLEKWQKQLTCLTVKNMMINLLWKT